MNLFATINVTEQDFLTASPPAALIIVNDIATRGGPIAAMIKNIALNGGNVCAIAVLAREDSTPAAVISQRLAG